MDAEWKKIKDHGASALAVEGPETVFLRRGLPLEPGSLDSSLARRGERRISVGNTHFKERR